MQFASALGVELTAQTLTPEAFAPYGDVFCRQSTPGRSYSDSALGSTRPAARPSLSMVLKLPLAAVQLDVLELERHVFSSQSFVPLDSGRWLIVVAPHATAGGPDRARACAFVATAQQGVTYRANTWHHSLTVLDRPGHFAVFMWREGTPADEEFVGLAPFKVRVPD